jgi:PST family polysaccharide transporter
MLALFKSSFWSLLSIGSRTISVLVINKLVGLQFGPQGITLLAHFQNLITIATTIPSDGVNMGLITYLAGQETTDNRYRRYFIGGVCWQAFIFMVVGGVFLSRKEFFLGNFLPSVTALTWVCLFFSGLLLLLVSTYLQAVMLARQALQFYTLLIIISSSASAWFIWYFLPALPLPYLLLMYPAGQTLAALVGLLITARQGWLPRGGWSAPDRQVLLDFGRFILMALTLVVCSKIVNFYVRDLMIRRFDLYQTGLWQAMVKLSDNYTLVFTSLIGTVYYPRLAALINHASALRRYVRTVFFAVVPVLGLGLLLFYFLQRYFIVWLFDEQFLPGAYLLDYIVLGDFFKMAAWLLSYLMMAQARTTLYMVVQIIAAAVYLGLLFWLVGQFGLPGITMAHCASFGLFLIFNLWFFRKLIF